jgi:hypothetical protein
MQQAEDSFAAAVAAVVAEQNENGGPSVASKIEFCQAKQGAAHEEGHEESGKEFWQGMQCAWETQQAESRAWHTLQYKLGRMAQLEDETAAQDTLDPFDCDDEEEFNRSFQARVRCTVHQLRRIEHHRDER